MTFGSRLREYRGHRGMSLGDLARATNYSRSYLSNIENGRKTATDDVASACDRALKATGELIAAARQDAAARLNDTPETPSNCVKRPTSGSSTSVCCCAGRSV